MELGVSYNNRLLFVGKTRTGKTVLARELITQFAKKEKDLQIITIDPKHELRAFGDGETIDAPKLATEYNKKAKYQVIQSYHWNDALDNMVDKIMARGHAIVNLLEMGGIATANSVPDGITRLWTQGAGKGVGAIAQLQFPKRNPGVVKSQSEFIFMFRLNPLEDRQEMLNYIPDKKILQKIPKYFFWLYHDDLDSAVYCKPLELKK